jgi:hypothetical protein
MNQAVTDRDRVGFRSRGSLESIAPILFANTKSYVVFRLDGEWKIVAMANSRATR